MKYFLIGTTLISIAGCIAVGLMNKQAEVFPKNDNRQFSDTPEYYKKYMKYCKICKGI